MSKRIAKKTQPLPSLFKLTFGEAELLDNSRAFIHQGEQIMNH